jgi:hypothetical protein
VADGYRIGVDIGGTFTDVVLLGAEGTLRTKKVLSTPDDYARGVVQGILELLEDTGAAPASVTKVVHATTVASNAVLEEGLALRPADDGRLPRRARVAAAADPGDVRAQYEKPRRSSRRLRYEIPSAPARAARSGSARREAVREAGQARDAGVAAVAISFLHAYANPATTPRRRDRPGGRRRRRLHHAPPTSCRDPRVRADEHGRRQRVRRPSRQRYIRSSSRAWPRPGSRLRFRSCSRAAA